MQILILTGLGERRFSSNDSLIRGLRRLGHDVVACGPRYTYLASDGKNLLELKKGDIILDDKPFPERYEIGDHKGIAYQLADRDWRPDFILQVEPHFYLDGPKIDFSPTIISQTPYAYYCIDTQCGGEWYYKYMREKENFFDVFLLGHPQFHYLFDDIKIPIYGLPLAFEEERFDRYMETVAESDIAFIGYTGIKRELLEEHCLIDDVGKYVTRIPHLGSKDYEDQSFFSYAERAEMLMRLMGDFNVRVYFDRVLDRRYEKAIRKGRIGFYYSLLRDFSLHWLEIAACGVPLISDTLPNTHDNDIESLFFYANTIPRNLYKPHHPNFSLDYLMLKRKVEYVLDNYEEAQAKANALKALVWNHHTWTHRAAKLVEIMEKYC